MSASHEVAEVRRRPGGPPSGTAGSHLVVDLRGLRVDPLLLRTIAKAEGFCAAAGRTLLLRVGDGGEGPLLSFDEFEHRFAPDADAEPPRSIG